MYLDVSWNINLILRFKQHLKNWPKFKRNSKQRPWRPPSREHPDLIFFDMSWAYCKYAYLPDHPDRPIFMVHIKSLQIHIISSWSYCLPWSSLPLSSLVTLVTLHVLATLWLCSAIVALAWGGHPAARKVSAALTHLRRWFLFSGFPLVFFLGHAALTCFHVSASAESEVKTTEKWHSCNRNALAIPAWEVYNTKIYFNIRFSDISKSKTPFTASFSDFYLQAIGTTLPILPDLGSHPKCNSH